MAKYKPTIGLEIHVGLSTKTKMFCSCLNDHDEKHPNVNICPVCMGHPGTLPTTNEEAIKKLMQVGAALNCQIAEFSKFDRKSYFYPDLPKGYQISQYDLPLCHSGWLEIETRDRKQETSKKKIRITRIHMEEDAGRLQHVGNDTLVDFNRAGTPLMELVTEPDLTTADDVRKFASELQMILRYVGASDANMEKGEMRVEVNLSLSKDEGWGLNQPGGLVGRTGLETKPVLGTKVEVKNINSISAAGRAVEYEIKRQTEVLDEGGKIVQETRGWDENKGKTVSQRTKEGSADYRYFPEPDIPPMRFPTNTVEDVKASLPELPQDRRDRFIGEYQLPAADVEVFTASKDLGDDYEKIVSEALEWENAQDKKLDSVQKAKLLKLLANYLITEFQKLTGGGVTLEETKITPENFAQLGVIVMNGAISSSAAQAVLAEMYETGADPQNVIDSKNLAQVSNESELETIADRVIMANPKAVEDYKKGKIDVLKFLVGQAMRESKGAGNPEVLAGVFKKKL